MRLQILRRAGWWAGVLWLVLLLGSSRADCAELTEAKDIRTKADKLVAETKFKDAEPLVKRYLELAKAGKAGDSPAAASLWVGQYYMKADQGDKAEAFLKDALEQFTHLRNEHWINQASYELRVLYSEQQRFAEALVLYRRTLIGVQKKPWTEGGWYYLNFSNVAYRVAEEHPDQKAQLAREAFGHAQRVKDSAASISLSQMALRGSTGDDIVAALARERQDLERAAHRHWEIDNTFGANDTANRDFVAEAANLKRWVEADAQINIVEKRLSAEAPSFNALMRPAPMAVAEVQNLIREDEALVLLLETQAWKRIPDWQEVFVWVVTKSDVRWIRTDLGGIHPDDIVRNLRCGLDASMWDAKGLAESCKQSLGAEPQRDKLGNVLVHTLPFDLGFAHFLYQQLLGEAADLIAGKHLLFVPSDHLAQLPLHVLVTKLSGADDQGLQKKTVGDLGIDIGELTDPERKRYRLKHGVAVIERMFASSPKLMRSDDILLSINGTILTDVAMAKDLVEGFAPGSKVLLRLLRKGKELTIGARIATGQVDEIAPRFLDRAQSVEVAWLARSNSYSILPTVSALRALRQTAKTSSARKPMLGLGNPLLDGDPAERPWEADWAAEARRNQHCGTPVERQIADAAPRIRGVRPAPMRSGRADLVHLRSQGALPDTARELCAAAAALNVGPEDVLLGVNATETRIKQMSAAGDLARYRVLHFATHGTLAGEIESTTEPGLILTPPAEQTDLDDGYLSASEIAGLKLDADWVILSACNTAAGEARGAEALSGLARSFMYAGARSLLVSHWAVDSVATVKLVTGAVTIANSGNVSRAEAMRRSMLDMIGSSDARETHPAFWAPFVLVGEGAAKP
jgi:tetratricopeptide (TPR) repeat protein